MSVPVPTVPAAFRERSHAASLRRITQHSAFPVSRERSERPAFPSRSTGNAGNADALAGLRDEMQHHRLACDAGVAPHSVELLKQIEEPMMRGDLSLQVGTVERRNAAVGAILDVHPVHSVAASLSLFDVSWPVRPFRKAMRLAWVEPSSFAVDEHLDVSAGVNENGANQVSFHSSHLQQPILAPRQP
jgi:hypothetical protein